MKAKIDISRDIQSLPLLLSNCVLGSPLRVMGIDGGGNYPRSFLWTGEEVPF